MPLIICNPGPAATHGESVGRINDNAPILKNSSYLNTYNAKIPAIKYATVCAAVIRQRKVIKLFLLSIVNILKNTYIKLPNIIHNS